MQEDDAPTPAADLTPDSPEAIAPESSETAAGSEARAPEPAPTDDLAVRTRALQAELAALEAQKAQFLQQRAAELEQTLAEISRRSLGDLERRQQELQVAVEQLERRRDRAREEMRTTFAGVSQDLAIRVQGFRDYLVGSLQDLAIAAEQIDLPGDAVPAAADSAREPAPRREETAPQPEFARQRFQEQVERIRSILDQYRQFPDYYGPPWQLRRTFEPVHAERVRQWFLTQGGRGAVQSLGSRLQNITVASAAISVLRALYGDRVRTLVLANSPERLGEWRRGLQDCLGIARSDFGPERGVVLFEDPEALVQKAERLRDDKQLPLIVADETEGAVSIALLQFPLWLAFAPDPKQASSYLY